jgi:hypothetical protein
LPPELVPIEPDPFIDEPAAASLPRLDWWSWFEGEWRDPAAALDHDFSPFAWR